MKLRQPHSIDESEALLAEASAPPPALPAASSAAWGLASETRDDSAAAVLRDEGAAAVPESLDCLESPKNPGSAPRSARSEAAPSSSSSSISCELKEARL